MRSTIDGSSFLLNHLLVDRVFLYGQPKCYFVGIGKDEVHLMLHLADKLIIIANEHHSVKRARCFSNPPKNIFLGHFHIQIRGSLQEIDESSLG